MAAGPQRHPDPAPHLLAHIVPVENALGHRAAELDESAAALEAPNADGSVSPAAEHSAAHARWLAGEFRALARELHHW
jgi:hypothetical protein